MLEDKWAKTFSDQKRRLDDWEAEFNRLRMEHSSNNQPTIIVSRDFIGILSLRLRCEQDRGVLNMNDPTLIAAMRQRSTIKNFGGQGLPKALISALNHAADLFEKHRAEEIDDVMNRARALY